MHSTVHMKKTLTFFFSPLLTLRKEEQMWSKSHSLAEIKLHTFHKNKRKIMGEFYDSTLIQASTHIFL